MFTVQPRKDTLESLELRDEDAKSFAVLAPTRGGMMSRLALGGRHLFFLDESTLRDQTKNVRGGNPVLFPTPGKLVSNSWKRGVNHGSLPQHGFGRNIAWEVAATGTDDGAWATLRLSSSEPTREDYPWDFVAEYTYKLRGSVMRIDQTFTNTGAGPMPFGAGFHPYFHVKQSEKAAARIETAATRAFDNVAKKEVPFALDLAKPEVDLHLLDHGSKPIILTWPAGKIAVRGSSEYSHFVVWTLAGKDFVCVEPWTSPSNALNTGDRLLELPPGEKRSLWVEYEAL